MTTTTGPIKMRTKPWRCAKQYRAAVSQCGPEGLNRFLFGK